MKTFLSKLLDLLKESTITQSLLVLLVFGPIGYNVLVGTPIPDVYTSWGGIIIGFFFGSKAAYQMIRSKER